MADKDTPFYADPKSYADIMHTGEMLGQMNMFDDGPFLNDNDIKYVDDIKYTDDDIKYTTKTQREIQYACEEIEKMLIEKNRKYGNSALDPARIFSKANPEEQLKVRIDDKISRMQQGETDDDEDVVDDLIGYLILLKVAKGRITPPKIDVSLPVDPCFVPGDKDGDYMGGHRIPDWMPPDHPFRKETR